MKKNLNKLLLLLLALCMLLACGCQTATKAPETTPEPTAAEPEPAQEPAAEEPPAEEPAAEVPAEPQLAADQTLTVAAGRCYWEEPTSVNCLHKNANVWEGLVTLNTDLELQYVLAKSMTVSDDGLVWTVELTDDAVFHDGTPFTAQIAIQNLDRTYHFNNDHYDPEYKNTANMGLISSMEATGEHSFVINFETPCFDFDYKISYLYGMMYSPSSWNEEGQVTTPCGTGPFVFESYDETTKDLVVVANESYRLGAPVLKKIVFKTITDADTRLSALQSGEIDAIVDTGALIPAQTAAVQASDSLVLASTPTTITLYAYMNTSGVLSDPVLREAISLCIDREAICSELLLGYGIPGSSVVTPVAAQWSKDEGYTYDPQAAKELVSAAYGDEPVTITMVLGSSSDRWPFDDVAVVMQSALAEAGIELIIDTVDNSTRGSRLKAQEYDITIMQHSLSTGEPNFFFANHMESSGSQTKARGTGLNDARVDELCAAASSISDYAEKKAVYDELQDIAKENYYILPVWHEVSAYAYQSYVQGLEMDSIFWTDLYAISLLEH